MRKEFTKEEYALRSAALDRVRQIRDSGRIATLHSENGLFIVKYRK